MDKVMLFMGIIFGYTFLGISWLVIPSMSVAFGFVGYTLDWLIEDD